MSVCKKFFRPVPYDGRPRLFTHFPHSLFLVFFCSDFPSVWFVCFLLPCGWISFTVGLFFPWFNVQVGFFLFLFPSKWLVYYNASSSCREVGFGIGELGCPGEVVYLLGVPVG